MIDSVYIALSGLSGYSRGLKVIANNTANLNTPGFKGSSLLFADMYYSGGGLGGPGTGGFGSYGLGLETLGTVLSFQQGQFQKTNNVLDLAVDGLGLFMVQDASGTIRYTRDGQFRFNSDGLLVTSSAVEEQVMAFGANGVIGPVNIADLRTQYADATRTVTFGGNITLGSNETTVGNVAIYDRAGTAHTLTVRFEAVPNTPGAWNVTVRDDTTQIGDQHQITFSNGLPVTGQNQFTINYGPDAIPIVFDFSRNVTCYGSGSSTIAMATQDGHPPGLLTDVTFDETGTLVTKYSNGQTVRGGEEGERPQIRLAMARFDSIDSVRAVGNNRFEAVDPRAWIIGFANDNGFGAIRSSQIEMSNVDLSSQFSDLVIMQRGYQASSQVVSTANEMMAELFGMKGK